MMRPFERTRTTLACFAMAVQLVLASCASTNGQVAPPASPPHLSANEACAQQQLAMTTAGIEAARALPADSIIATSAAQSRYAIAVAEYHACLASH